MPTFLQLYRLLSVYKLVKPPKSGNCEIIKQNEATYFSMGVFKSVFSTGAASSTKLCELKAKLDGLIECEQWEYEELFPTHDHSHAVTECVLYFVAGFVARKFKRSTCCQTCTLAFSVSESHSPEAELVNLKSRGWLTYPNKNLVKMLHEAENYFQKTQVR